MSDDSKSTMVPDRKTFDELGYIKSPRDLGLDDDFFTHRLNDTFIEKAKKKSIQNPFVPIGKALQFMGAPAQLSPTAHTRPEFN